MLCEMCGTEVESLNRVRIEGTVLGLCPNCSRFGTVIGAPPSSPAAPGGALGGSGDGRSPTRSRNLAERDLYADIPELDLVPDWSKRVRVAREKLAWTPEEFAKRLNEKKSVVLKIESGHFHPADSMVRKIEMMLKVRLRANPGETP